MNATQTHTSPEALTLGRSALCGAPVDQRRCASAHTRRRCGHGSAGSRHELPGARRGWAATAAHCGGVHGNACVRETKWSCGLLGSLATSSRRPGLCDDALAHGGQLSSGYSQGREPVHSDCKVQNEHALPMLALPFADTFPCVSLCSGLGPRAHMYAHLKQCDSKQASGLLTVAAAAVIKRTPNTWTRPNLITLRPKITIQNDSSFRPRRHHRAQRRSTTTTPCG